MPDPDPRAFIAEYVEPAIAAFKVDQTVKHLAAHALAQVDILAAVVANHQLLAGRAKLDRNEEGDFRRDLGQRIGRFLRVTIGVDSDKPGDVFTAAERWYSAQLIDEAEAVRWRDSWAMHREQPEPMTQGP